MSEVVDFMAFKATRGGSQPPRSVLEDCLMHDTLEDLTALVDRLSEYDSQKDLHLTELDRDQLDLLAMLADTFLDFYEILGFNLVEEG